MGMIQLLDSGENMFVENLKPEIIKTGEIVTVRQGSKIIAQETGIFGGVPALIF